MGQPKLESFDHGKGRRQFLRAGAALGLPGFLLTTARPGTASGCDAPITNGPFNGSNCPVPIPWLDKNGSHNQMPKVGVEPASIFHFKGLVARCNDWTGMGTDNHGNRIAFGSPSTDFSLMRGEYFAGRQSHQGTFAHI